MGFFEAIRTCYSKMVIWKGRATRAEFWWFTLYLMLLGAAVGVAMIGGVIHLVEMRPDLLPDTPAMTATPDAHIAALPKDVWMWGAGLNLVTLFVFVLPNLAVLVRRLHDSGHSGWWYWIALIPVVGIVILIVLLILPGDAGHNRHGPPPAGDAPPKPSGGMTGRTARRGKGAAAQAMAPDDEFRDYYRRTVEPALRRPKPGDA